MKHELLWVVISIFGFGLLYVLVLFVGAFLTTKSAPRKPMFWCERHGPIPYDGVIKFMEHEVCGTCFHERLKSAEKGQL